MKQICSKLPKPKCLRCAVVQVLPFSIHQYYCIRTLNVFAGIAHGYYLPQLRSVLSKSARNYLSRNASAAPLCRYYRTILIHQHFIQLSLLNVALLRLRSALHKSAQKCLSRNASAGIAHGYYLRSNTALAVLLEIT